MNRKWMPPRDLWPRYARTAVSEAIKSGLLVRAKTCARADATCKGRIEAHHCNGYEPAAWLKVEWLCVSHHRRADGAADAVPRRIRRQMKESRVGGSNSGPPDYESGALPLS